MAGSLDASLAGSARVRRGCLTFGAVLALLAPAAGALAKDSPPKSGQYSSVQQYREMLPGAEGPSVLGDESPTTRPLPRQTTERIREEGGEDARVIEEIATSSSYGAPQQALPKAKPPKATRDPKTGLPHDEGNREPDLAPVRRRADGAVYAAAGGIFSDTSGGRFGFLAFLLVASTAACVAGAIVRRRTAGR